MLCFREQYPAFLVSKSCNLESSGRRSLTSPMAPTRATSRSSSPSLIWIPLSSRRQAMCCYIIIIQSGFFRYSCNLFGCSSMCVCVFLCASWPCLTGARLTCQHGQPGRTWTGASCGVWHSWQSIASQGFGPNPDGWAAPDWCERLFRSEAPHQQTGICE